MTASTAERDALDLWIRAALRDGKAHRESDLVTRWRMGPGKSFNEEAASNFMHERLKSLEIGMSIVRAPGADDAWWSPN